MGIKEGGGGGTLWEMVDGKMWEDRFLRWQEPGKMKDAFLPMNNLV